jgi:ABC-type phosphate/phosphonate transport system substrate-binding protein/tRNA A-37 threonylcarbamoyl transferase component Bud32
VKAERDTSSPVTCDVCGTSVPLDAPLGQCPSCLLDWAEKEVENVDPAQDLPRPFGDYELLRQVGCGGMGVVYEARHTRLKRQVALKMIRPDLASKRFLRRFLIEGEAAARLDHPNIIPIYEIKEDGPDSFLSMQFVPGETLKEKIARGDFRLERSQNNSARDWLPCQRASARLMAAVARAIQHAHERGVFHRDLKPGNILVDSLGQPHIADFGVAKIIREQEQFDAASTLTVPGAALGTPEYMAPEQASSSGLVDSGSMAAADIYSLGALLYELLTGRPPFRGSSNLETLQKVREGDLKRPRAINPGLSRDLETIALKCLERNPDARYASAADVASELERWLAGQPITARPASQPARVARWVKRNPVVAALMVSLFFGVAISLTFVWVLNDRMRTAEINKALTRQTYFQKINDLWALPVITNILIPSTLLAELREQPARPFVEERDIRMSFGLSAAQDPVNRAYSVAPILGNLEIRMARQLGSNVFIDLLISKAPRLDSSHLSSGEADVHRFDAVSYVAAKIENPRLIPLLLENDADEIVFCVAQDSGITNLTQLTGKTIGFGDVHSAVTVLAQHCLLTNGLRRSDFTSVEYFTSASHVSKTTLPQFGSAEIVTDMREIKGGREALRHLIEGKIDVAVTLKRYFETRRHRGPGLRAIARVQAVPEVFVARGDLDPRVRESFRQAMLSLEQSPGLGTLSSFRTVSGVLATDDSYFDGLRLALANVHQNFEPIVSAAPSATAVP